MATQFHLSKQMTLPKTKPKAVSSQPRQGPSPPRRNTAIPTSPPTHRCLMGRRRRHCGTLWVERGWKKNPGWPSHSELKCPPWKGRTTPRAPPLATAGLKGGLTGSWEAAARQATTGHTRYEESRPGGNSYQLSLLRTDG